MALVLRGVRKTYPRPGGGMQLVLDVPHLEVADGERVCLVGGSGSGKTTLLNVIAGITLPDAGSVEFDGTDVTTLAEGARDRFRARHVGYMFQVFNLLQGYSALENVVLPMHFAGVGAGHAQRRAAELLDRVGIGPKSRNRPAALSVGEQQRVALARALACKPKLVIADEPTANLDPENAESALALLDATTRESGATLFVVTHDERVKSRFPRVETLGAAS